MRGGTTAAVSPELAGTPLAGPADETAKPVAASRVGLADETAEPAAEPRAGPADGTVEPADALPTGPAGNPARPAGAPLARPTDETESQAPASGGFTMALASSTASPGAAMTEEAGPEVRLDGRSKPPDIPSAHLPGWAPAVRCQAVPQVHTLHVQGPGRRENWRPTCAGGTADLRQTRCGCRDKARRQGRGRGVGGAGPSGAPWPQARPGQHDEPVGELTCPVLRATRYESPAALLMPCSRMMTRGAALDGAG